MQAALPMSTNEKVFLYESGCEIGRNIEDAGVTVVYGTADGHSHLHKGVMQSIQERQSITSSETPG